LQLLETIASQPLSKHFDLPILSEKSPYGGYARTIYYGKGSDYMCSVMADAWITSCAVANYAQLSINHRISDREELLPIVARLLTTRLYGDGLVGKYYESWNQNKFFMLTHTQIDVIKIIEKLGFVRLKDSEMINPVHGSQLAIWARFWKK
jgi:hypothetical protein